MMKKYILLIVIILISVLGLRIVLQGDNLHPNWQRENFWLKKANLSTPFDVVVLGDSRIYAAVNPDQLKNNPNDKVINFGFSSISYTEHYLKKAHSIMAPQADVWVGLTAESLTNFESDQGFRSYESQSPLLVQQFMKWTRIYWPMTSLDMLIERGFSPFTNQNVQKADDLFHENGWIETRREPTLDTSSMAMSYKNLAAQYRIQDVIIQNLEKQIKLWALDGKKVYFFWVCFEVAVCKEEETLFDQGLRDNINQRLVKVGGTLLTVDKEKFLTFDGDHLTGPEAQKFSAYLKQTSMDH